MKKLIQSHKVKILGIISLMIVIMVMIVSLNTNVNEMSLENKLSPPSKDYIFGTDHLGRDMFLRTLTGFRNSFLLSMIVVMFNFFIGSLLGTALGYFGGIFDEIFYHISNVILSFPALLTAIFLSVVLGSGIKTLLIVNFVFGTINNSKTVRSEIMLVKNEDYITSLRVSGISEARIFFYHMYPRGLFVKLPLVPLLIGHIMITISGFSFLGLGVQPPTPEVGVILKDALRFMKQAPWLIIIPGIFQFLAVTIFSMFSEEMEKELKRGPLGGIRE